MAATDAGAALLATLCAAPQSPPEPPPTAVVAAHPDDETVGAGARLERLAAAEFIYLTTGATRTGGDAQRRGLAAEDFAALRRRELDALFAACGMPGARRVFLPVHDQEAALQLEATARSLAERFASRGTAAVLTHAYEGGHPDHDAAAFAVHAAVALLRRSGRPAPAIVEMSSYHLGPQGLRSGSFLPHPQVPASTVALTPEQQRRKLERMACFESQRQTLAWFALGHECFRAAPPYDFGRPPHAGTLFYEQHPWNMDAQRFCGLALQAQEALGIRGPL